MNSTRKRSLLAFCLFLVIFSCSLLQYNGFRLPNVLSYHPTYSTTNVTNYPVYPKAKEIAERKAFVTIISGFDRRYGAWAMMTGYWLRKFHPDIPRIIIHIKGLELEESSKRNLEKWGWQFKEVEGIPPPYENEDSTERYHWLFTKFRLWEMVEYDRVIYLDLDVIVSGNFNELWKISPNDFPFGAVMDNWFGSSTANLNAGFLLITPSLDTFNSLMEVSKDPYHIERYSKNGLAEQGFLNYYYESNYLRLPDKFALNIEGFHDCRNYMHVLEDVRLIHMTSRKPQLNNEVVGVYCPWFKAAQVVRDSTEFAADLNSTEIEELDTHQWIIEMLHGAKDLNCDQITCENIDDRVPFHKDNSG